MGYYINMNKSKFKIYKKNKDKSLKEIKKLVKNNKEFLYIDTESVLNSKTLEEAIKEWNYEADIDKYGNIIGIEFIGEKLGDEYELFKCIAKFVEDDSYIEIIGENGYSWRWIFNNKICIEKYSSIL